MPGICKNDKINKQNLFHHGGIITNHGKLEFTLILTDCIFSWTHSVSLGFSKPTHFLYWQEASD